MTTETMSTYGYRVPNQPKTPKQSMRMGALKWGRFGIASLSVKSNRTEVMSQLVDWFLRVPGAELPERPTEEEIERIAAMSQEEILAILRRPRRRDEDAE
jgi:hypothetical protein